MVYLRSLVAVFVTLFAGFLLAEPYSGAHKMVEETTNKVVLIIEEARAYVDEDPQRFYDEVEAVLDSVVDFNSFSRGVMGEYGSKKSYRALNSDEEKALFKARITRFSKIFREGLVQTYAKGLMLFNGNRIEVMPPQEGDSSKNSSTVIQYIYGEREQPYVIRYKVRLNGSGEWKLRNVTIEAANLGKLYRSQFRSAVLQYDGDIDKAIDNWSSDPGDNSVAKNESTADVD